MGVGRVGMFAMTKAVAGGAVAGAVVVGTSAYVQHRASPPPSITQVQVSPAPPSGGFRKADGPTASPPVGATEEKIAATDEVSSPGARAVAAAQRPRDEGGGATSNPAPAPRPLDTPAATAPDPAPIAKPSALAREIALLDESRGALARNDSREALRLLDRYAREFEQGNLWPEAVVLKIDALLRQGDVQPARFLADQFERARPNDSHVSRIESLFSNAGVP